MTNNKIAHQKRKDAGLVTLGNVYVTPETRMRLKIAAIRQGVTLEFLIRAILAKAGQDMEEGQW
jgi:hypothetical protein